MSIPLISNITQKNDEEFWLVDSNAIYGGLYHVDTEEQMNLLPKIRLKEGMLCYIKTAEKYYKYFNSEWIEFYGLSDYVILEDEIQEIMGIFKNGMIQ